MHWICPACGYKNSKDLLMCACGYQADESILMDSADAKPTDESKGGILNFAAPAEIIDTDMPSQQIKQEDVKIKIKASEKPVKTKREQPTDEIIIKEIDSWTFSFSPSEQCIYAGTPALHPFRLKLTLNDLQELLEFMYEKSGMEKPTKGLQLSLSDVLELVEVVDKTIEEKRSRVKLKFSSEEVQQIADIINKKLKK